jgi:hypothetical protein
MKWLINGLLLATCFSAGAFGQEFDFSGQIAVEGRLFTQDALRDGLYRGNASVWAEPEFFAEWHDGKHMLTFTPFGRVDQHDARRTHGDIRELSYQYNARGWELRMGLRKVFWGVTESNHLVDVINQTDLVENLDGEEKLGQPMVNFALIRDWGTLDVYVLPGFRKRRFWADDGRPGVPFAFDDGLATFDSDRGRGHVDLAARWSHSIGLVDVGVSHFRGTSRDPRFFQRQAVFAPHYDIINQTGLDLQLTSGGWLWKLEATNRAGQGDRFAAVTGGFEYTFVNLKNSGIDIGVLTEYSFDERDELALTPLEDDVFFGVRLALNDVQSTALLAGAAVDRETGASFINVEASRRVGSRTTLEVEYRAFVGVPAEDFFSTGFATTTTCK